jgi:hypothetical protein
MHSRPIRRQYRGPATASAPYSATGGEDLGELIAEVDEIRQALGYPRWSSLRPWCDDGDPLTTNGDGLELLIERLSAIAVDRGLYPHPIVPDYVQNSLKV